MWTESAACPGLEAACPPLALLGPHHQRPESLPLLLSALPEVVRLPTLPVATFLIQAGTGQGFLCQRHIKEHWPQNHKS